MLTHTDLSVMGTVVILQLLQVKMSSDIPWEADPPWSTVFLPSPSLNLNLPVLSPVSDFRQMPLIAHRLIVLCFSASVLAWFIFLWLLFLTFSFKLRAFGAARIGGTHPYPRTQSPKQEDLQFKSSLSKSATQWDPIVSK